MLVFEEDLEGADPEQLPLQLSATVKYGQRVADITRQYGWFRALRDLIVPRTICRIRGHAWLYAATGEHYYNALCAPGDKDSRYFIRHYVCADCDASAQYDLAAEYYRG